MKGYFQLSAQERMDLTDKEIKEKYIPFYLMEQGIFSPEEPEYLAVPEETAIKPEGITMYRLSVSEYSSGSLVFDKEEQFNAFVALNPQKVGYEHIGGKQYHYIEAETDITASMITIYSVAEVKAYKRASKDRNDALERNKEMRSRYRRELSALEGETQSIWDDWHSLQDKKRLLARILSTFEDYVELAGDTKVALGFLYKVKEYDKWDIYYAFKFATKDLSVFEFEDGTVPPDFE